MSSEPVFSFVYDKNSALEQFKSVGSEQVILAVLATAPPDSQHDGCEVLEGESPLGTDTVCIVTRGSEADTLQQVLIEGLERVGVKVLQVYEGGPQDLRPLARAEQGRWVTA